MGWTSLKKKEDIFCTVQFVRTKILNIYFLSQCIVYWIHFQNIHSFTYQKTLLHTLLLLIFKNAKCLQCIIKVWKYPRMKVLSDVLFSSSLITPYLTFFILLTYSGWAFSKLLTDGGKRSSFPKICHTYPTMMKLSTVTSYLQKIQKINESRYTSPWILITSAFFYRKSVNFAYQEIQI